MEEDKKDCKLSISCIRCSKGENYIQILVEDSSYHIIFRGKTSLENLSLALTGLGNVPIEREY